MVSTNLPKYYGYIWSPTPPYLSLERQISVLKIFLYYSHAFSIILLNMYIYPKVYCYKFCFANLHKYYHTVCILLNHASSTFPEYNQTLKHWPAHSCPYMHILKSLSRIHREWSSTLLHIDKLLSEVTA